LLQDVTDDELYSYKEECGSQNICDIENKTFKSTGMAGRSVTVDLTMFATRTV
jgi:hypothetical protein